MKCVNVIAIGLVAGLMACAQGAAVPDDPKNSLSVPGGLGFAEFKGYEKWQVVSISHNGDLLAATLGNPEMIAAFQQGIPDNGKPFPDGARMAKIHWNPKKHAVFQSALVPGSQHDVDFMVKDIKRFAASGGWGYAMFRYDSTAAGFVPGDSTDAPPQGKNASCGFGCHTIVEKRDFVFTEYAPR